MLVSFMECLRKVRHGRGQMQLSFSYHPHVVAPLNIMSQTRHNGVNVGFKPTVRAALSIPVPYDPDALIWLWQYLPAL